MLGAFDLCNCFRFVTVISTFDTASSVFCVKLISSSTFLLGENFNCSDYLSQGVVP